MERIITADEARQMSKPIEITLFQVMGLIETACKNGSEDCVFNLRRNSFSQDTLSALKDAGYTLKRNSYSDGVTFLTVSWEKPQANIEKV